MLKKLSNNSQFGNNTLRNDFSKSTYDLSSIGLNSSKQKKPPERPPPPKTKIQIAESNDRILSNDLKLFNEELFYNVKEQPVTWRRSSQELTSRIHKSPPSPSAIALFDLDTGVEGDLCFRADDQLKLVEHINDEWMMGVNLRTQQKGIFPINFVQVTCPLPPPPQPPPSAAPADLHGDSAQLKWSNPLQSSRPVGFSSAEENSQKASRPQECAAAVSVTDRIRIFSLSGGGQMSAAPPPILTPKPVIAGLRSSGVSARRSSARVDPPVDEGKIPTNTTSVRCLVSKFSANPSTADKKLENRNIHSQFRHSTHLDSSSSNKQKQATIAAPIADFQARRQAISQRLANQKPADHNESSMGRENIRGLEKPNPSHHKEENITIHPIEVDFWDQKNNLEVSDSKLASSNQKSNLPVWKIMEFDFNGADAKDLKLSAGELVLQQEDLGHGWLQGKVNSSRHGRFPATFCHNASSAEIPTAKAIYEFCAETDEDLSMNVKDEIVLLEELNADWLRGLSKSSGHIGMFPKSFVIIVRPLP